MLEIIIRHNKQTIRVDGPSPIDTFTTLPKSNAAAGMYGDVIMVAGGIAGGSSPYPNYSYVINTVTKVTTHAAGYDATYASGTVLNGRLYFNLGHTGVYNDIINYRPFPTGLPKSGSYYTGKGKRAAPVFAAIDNTRAYWGLGWNNKNSESNYSDLFIFNSSDNRFSALPSDPNYKSGSAVVSPGVVDSRGVLFVTPRSQSFNRLKVYDPITNSWGVTSQFWVDEDFNIANSSSVHVNGKIYIFSGRFNLREPYNEGNYLRCLRYDIAMDRFALLEFRSIPALYQASVVASPNGKVVYVVSGMLPDSSLAADNRPRSTVVYKFDVSALSGA